MTPAVPVVEAADHADPLGIGGPDGEARADDAFDREDLCAKHLPELQVASLGEQVQIEFADGGQEAVGIDHPVLVTVAERDAVFRVGGNPVAWQGHLEYAGIVRMRVQVDGFAIAVLCLHPARMRLQRAQAEIVLAVGVYTKDPVRVVVANVDQGLEVVFHSVSIRDC